MDLPRLGLSPSDLTGTNVFNGDDNHVHDMDIGVRCSCMSCNPDVCDGTRGGG